MLGAKTFKEYRERLIKHFPQLKDCPGSVLRDNYNSVGKNTHIFRGDIKPENIVGGKGYKKRTLNQTVKYIKNNPSRFGKEAAKDGIGVGLGSYAIKKIIDSNKK